MSEQNDAISAKKRPHSRTESVSRHHRRSWLVLRYCSPRRTPTYNRGPWNATRTHALHLRAHRPGPRRPACPLETASAITFYQPELLSPNGRILGYGRGKAEIARGAEGDGESSTRDACERKNEISGARQKMRDSAIDSFVLFQDEQVRLRRGSVDETAFLAPRLPRLKKAQKKTPRGHSEQREESPFGLDSRKDVFLDSLGRGVFAMNSRPGKPRPRKKNRRARYCPACNFREAGYFLNSSFTGAETGLPSRITFTSTTSPTLLRRSASVKS
jgi:hypothetical protein